MDGRFRVGEFVLPDGETVRVFRTYAGDWACVIESVEGTRLTAAALTAEVWSRLAPRAHLAG